MLTVHLLLSLMLRNSGHLENPRLSGTVVPVGLPAPIQTCLTVHQQRPAFQWPLQHETGCLMSGHFALTLELLPMVLYLEPTLLNFRKLVKINFGYFLSLFLCQCENFWLILISPLCWPLRILNLALAFVFLMLVLLNFYLVSLLICCLKSHWLCSSFLR